jgi:hypothetical protein
VFYFCLWDKGKALPLGEEHIQHSLGIIGKDKVARYHGTLEPRFVSQIWVPVGERLSILRVSLRTEQASFSMFFPISLWNEAGE